MKFPQSNRTSKDEIECNLCGQNHFMVVEDDQRPYRVLKCKNCSLVFVHPQPDPTRLSIHYDEGYYSQWIDEQKPRRLVMWRRRLKKINKLRSPGRLLDVGCGEGTFLTLAQKDGWKIAGTEISGFASKHAAGLLKTDIFCGDLFSAKFEDHSFDVVTMWHVLEHVGSPKQYLSEIHRILKPKGLLVLAVPNINNIIFQMIYCVIKRRKMKLFTIGEKEIHLYHFSPDTIRDYLEKTRFDCIKLSPDFGIIDFSKKVVNWFSVIFYYFLNRHVYDAMEIFSVKIGEESQS